LTGGCGDRTVWMESIHATVQAPPEDEGAILEALSRRDFKKALTLLMGLYGRAIYNYCRHLLGDASLAEDVHQTTFAQAYTDLAHYRSQSSLRIWLYAIARHRCMDMVKMEKRRGRHVETRETLPDTDAGEVSAEELALIASNNKQVARCLGKLDETIRDAILQRFMEQMSYEEMARVTGERAATLQMRVARALPGLRKCLEEAGVTL
jgi:RNA polymerase sigma factor (sigma-70 family)